jgi:DNA-binding LytR/AlgR family response regulator
MLPWMFVGTERGQSALDDGPQAVFVPIHRFSIVNLNRIREIYREGPPDGSILLKSGQALRMSKAGRQKLIEMREVTS